MRKLTYAIALSTFLLAGCSQDEGIMESKGELVTLNYNVSLGKDVQSRNTTGDDASSEGTSSEGTTPTLAVNKLLCVVYEGENEVLREIVPVDAEGKATFQPKLFTTIDYRIVFWAYYDGDDEGDDADFFNLTDLTNIIVKDNYYTTDEANVYKDAFTFFEDVNLSKGTGGDKVTLTRPFAQVTLLTSVTDYNNVADADHLSSPEKCVLTIESCQSVYNAKTGQWGDGNDISVTSNVSTTETKTINGVHYYYLANEYIFAGGKNVTCGIIVKDKDDNEIYNNDVESMPLTGNQSTNMYNENLLVGTVNYTITIDQGAFDDDSNKEI